MTIKLSVNKYNQHQIHPEFIRLGEINSRMSQPNLVFDQK
jgi:hypothetical protein